MPHLERGDPHGYPTPLLTLFVCVCVSVLEKKLHGSTARGISEMLYKNQLRRCYLSEGQLNTDSVCAGLLL